MSVSTGCRCGGIGEDGCGGEGWGLLGEGLFDPVTCVLLGLMFVLLCGSVFGSITVALISLAGLIVVGGVLVASMFWSDREPREVPAAGNELSAVDERAAFAATRVLADLATESGKIVGPAERAAIEAEVTARLSARAARAVRS